MRRISRKRLLYLAAFLVFIASLCVLGYPRASDWLYRYAAWAEIEDYDEAVAGKDQGQIENIRQEAVSYNALLGGEGNTSEGVSLASYKDLLAVTDAIGYLEIPKLSVYLPIYHGLEDATLEKGIGHMPDSSLPVGGESTHCVLSGHSGLPAAKLLTDLDRMEEGDIFYLHVLDEVLAYEVDQIQTVLPEDSSALAIEKGKDYVTLLTCTPYGINTHRLLVRGERTEYSPKALSLEASEKNQSAGKNGMPPKLLVICGAAAVCGAVILIILLILFLPERERQKKKE